LIRSTLAWVHDNLNDKPDARRVEKTVQKILQMNLEDLCCRAADLQCGPAKSREPEMEGVAS
jgi:hypothetical protein